MVEYTMCEFPTVGTDHGTIDIDEWHCAYSCAGNSEKYSIKETQIEDRFNE